MFLEHLRSGLQVLIENKWSTRLTCKCEKETAMKRIELKQDIPLWPDSTLNSEKRQNITNSYWTVYGSGARGNNYYTQVDSSTGATMDSSRLGL